MNRATALELLPHYAAMLLLVFVALEAWRLFVGDLGLVGELVVVVVIVFAYRPVVVRLGLAPETWRD